MGRHGLPRHRAHLPGPTHGHPAVQEHEPGRGPVAALQHDPHRPVHRLRVQDTPHPGQLQRGQVHRLHHVLDVHRLARLHPHLLRHGQVRLPRECRRVTVLILIKGSFVVSLCKFQMSRTIRDHILIGTFYTVYIMHAHT